MFRSILKWFGVSAPSRQEKDFISAYRETVLASEETDRLYWAWIQSSQRFYQARIRCIEAAERLKNL